MQFFTDEFYIKYAQKQANNFSTCLRRKVGAIIVNSSGIIISSGVNHTIHKKNCSECYRQKQNIPSGQGLDMCYALHAEADAIINALKVGHSLENTKLYVTTHPCSSCAKLILAAGIKKVFYASEYDDALSQEILASISLTKVDSIYGQESINK